jgi:alpha-mannosidase
MGDDFAYYKAEESFHFVERIKEILSSDKFEFRYSSPKLYIEAVKEEAKERSMEFPVFRGDFFPIMFSYKNHFWSGYFTSIPNFKKLIRDISS